MQLCTGFRVAAVAVVEEEVVVVTTDLREVAEGATADEIARNAPETSPIGSRSSAARTAGDRSVCVCAKCDVHTLSLVYDRR